jgi:prophage regulatory protein
VQALEVCGSSLPRTLAWHSKTGSEDQGMKEVGDSELRVVRLKQLIVMIGLSRSTIYDRMNPKSPRYDDSFPRSIGLGGKAKGWFLQDVKVWLGMQAQLSKGTDSNLGVNE